MGIVKLRDMLGRKYVVHSLILCEIHVGSSKWRGHHSLSIGSLVKNIQ